jgi:ferrous iron transport protein A
MVKIQFRRMKYMKYKDLTQIRKGKDVKIVDIIDGNTFREKVDSMGLRIGVRVRKLSGQVLNGPITIKIGNTKVALGHGMAKKILVISEQE